MDDIAQVQCPYCFQVVEIVVDPGTRGEVIEDCEVCCRPWRMLIRRRRDGSPLVTVERAQ